MDEERKMDSTERRRITASNDKPKNRSSKMLLPNFYVQPSAAIPSHKETVKEEIEEVDMDEVRRRSVIRNHTKKLTKLQTNSLLQDLNLKQIKEEDNLTLFKDLKNKVITEENTARRYSEDVTMFKF